MKRIGILGDIGSGKTYVAKCFGYPIFNADLEVAKISISLKELSKTERLCDIKGRLPLHVANIFPRCFRV